MIARTDRRGVAELRLDRPERRNAVTTELLRTLLRELGAAVRDGAGAIVLTGSPPSFCAGADLDELGPDAPEERRVERIRLVGEAVRRLGTLEVPTIAAVEGAAVGAGWGLALGCDLCLATADARFSLPELSKGFRIPEQLTRRLIAVVGPTRAAQLAYTGAVLSAGEAHAIGVVAQVLPDREALLATAHDLATSLAARPPQSVAAVKRPLAAFNSNEE